VDFFFIKNHSHWVNFILCERYLYYCYVMYCWSSDPVVAGISKLSGNIKCREKTKWKIIIPAHSYYTYLKTFERYSKYYVPNIKKDLFVSFRRCDKVKDGIEIKKKTISFIISQFTDFIISGFQLISDKKLRLKNMFVYLLLFSETTRSHSLLILKSADLVLLGNPWNITNDIN